MRFQSQACHQAARAPAFDVEQVATYFADLKTRLAGHDGSDEGVVVLLVPEHRSQEARAVLSRFEAAEVKPAESPLLHTAVWSYSQVLDALEEALGNYQRIWAQFEQLEREQP